MTKNKWWIDRHLSDPYVKKANQEGYPSRAAYKLLEIQEKERIIVPGMNIVDLGAAPGGWSMVAKKLIGRILAHRELRGLRRILLATRDAHRLYTPFGFKPLSHPERFLTISVPNPYQPKRQIKRRSAP